jgi:hypothetical protein
VLSWKQNKEALSAALTSASGATRARFCKSIACDSVVIKVKQTLTATLQTQRKRREFQIRPGPRKAASLTIIGMDFKLNFVN